MTRGRVLVAVTVAAFAAYVVVMLLADVRKLGDLSQSYAWRGFPLLLALAGANYLVRFVRWQYYLRRQRHDVPAGASLSIFLSGLFMAISPGKLGEVLKSVLLKRRFGIPISETAAVVVGERVTDLTSVLLLSLLGFAGIGVGGDLVLAGSALVGLGLVLILWRAPLRWLLARLDRIPRLAGLAAKGHVVLEALAALLHPAPFLVGNVLGLVAWGAEALAFYLLLTDLGAAATLQSATFVYAVAALAGAVSMLPGGLLATEGSMVGLLLLLGVTGDRAVAVFATLVIRFATLWFAVLVGAVSFLPSRRLAADADDPAHSG
jgi:uncharacterized membrane protein YbhN (UPF0104 family)